MSMPSVKHIKDILSFKTSGVLQLDTVGSFSKRDIVNKMKNIAVRIRQHKGVYLGDFKAGEDTRFKFDIGVIDDPQIVG
jgi:phage tail tube protein FII